MRIFSSPACRAPVGRAGPGKVENVAGPGKVENVAGSDDWAGSSWQM